MTYHLLDPEVAGGLGPTTKYQQVNGGKDVLVEPLHYEFLGWMGDDIVASTSYFVVTKRLADAIEASELTGCEFTDVLVTRSPEYASNETEFPDEWRRLLPVGSEDTGNDIVYSEAGDLLINDKALEFLLDNFTIVEAFIGDDDGVKPTQQVLRFREQVAAARAAQSSRFHDKVEEEKQHERALAAELAALVNAAPDEIGDLPTANTTTKRKITGDITRAIAALNKPVDDPRCVSLFRLYGGEVTAQGTVDLGRDRVIYKCAEGAFEVRITKGVVLSVRFHDVDGGDFPREAQIIDGVDHLTREAVTEVLGEPRRSIAHDATTAGFTGFDEHRLGGKRVMCYYKDDRRWLILIGKHAS